jgi:leucyl-tRNA synthetase
MKQWMLRITAYADRLLEDLDTLDWADSIKEMQRNWIGKSQGASAKFTLQPGQGATLPAAATLDVYTTRPDTIFGATYMVVAPEHPLVADLATPERAAEVRAYVEAAARKSDLERTELAKDKTGVFTGSYAINPATGDPIPVWVADYVLGSYGSGAIMAVPGHDTRDYEFARAFGLPVRRVVAPPPAPAGDDGSNGGGNGATANESGAAHIEDDVPYIGIGTAVNSSSPDSGLDLNGLSTADAKARATSWLAERGLGGAQTNYKLRDWLFARQRYWGEPFPVVFPEGSDEPVGIPESELPLTLPDTDDFAPSGTPDPPLAKQTEWVAAIDPRTGGPAKRETSTMPQWAGSCWYYLRYIDPANSAALLDPEAEKYWMPVDLYVGGAEHAVLHLLYARFWHKVLYDAGVVSTPEPFRRLVSQGMILGEVEYSVHRDVDGRLVEEGTPGSTTERVEPGDVEPRGGGYVLRSDPSVKVTARAHKMSKSRGNVVNPDDVVGSYGADSLRLYEMFMGPLRETKVWNAKGVEGVHRFLARVYRLISGAGAAADGAGSVSSPPLDDGPATKDQLRLLHATIKRVTEETEEMRFNTAIAAMMEFVNGAYKWETRPKEVLRPFVLLLAPYAPHLAEEMWQVLGGGAGSLTYEPWPEADESLLVEDTIKLPVQVNGKTRGTVEVPKGCDQGTAVAAAQALTTVQKQLDGKELKKVIFVADKILNLVAK